MRLAVFICLAAIPLIEIALLVQVGQWIGLWWTLALIIATAIGGSYVLHTQGFAVMQRTMTTMAAGKPPVGPMVDGAFLMLAGLLLIAPGLITDGLGLLMLIPQLRHRVAAWSVRKFLRSATFRSTTFNQTRTEWPGASPKAEAHARPSEPAAAPGEGPVIDGEFERIDERTVDARRRTNGADHSSADGRR